MNNEERQFERDLNPEEQHIDALLSNAMAVPMPTGLEERITSASLQQLAEACDQVLEQQLDHAFAIPAPEQLTTRIYNASVGDLRNGQPVVIARINRGVIWREVALAASILFAVFVAIRFGPVQPSVSTQTQIASNVVLSLEDEELLLEDLNLSDYSYLTDTRELAFADVAIGLENIRNDLELWQYGLLSD
jgi:hypothetical protein